jgi:HEPN domain-containing protein
MKKLTADWIRKAESDYRVAEKLARIRPPENDFVCFCCQQAAEKFLKALLVELGLNVPRTHNLEDLLGLLRPHHPSLFALRRGLVFLTRFAVDTRYPGFHVRRSQVDAARRWAGRVRTETHAILGLRTRRPPRKHEPRR